MKVVIGGARKDRIPALVCEWSIRRFATRPVEIIQTWDKDLPGAPCPTGFSFVRFQVPQLCGRHGRALYVDSDMLIFGDVAEFQHTDFAGKKVLRSPPQTAVMLIDCERSPWVISEILAERSAGRPHADFLNRLWPLTPEEIGYLGREWNMCDAMEAGTKLLHYTSIPTQPWRRKGHPLDSFWQAAFTKAIACGMIKPQWIEEDVKFGYIIV